MAHLEFPSDGQIQQIDEMVRTHMPDVLYDRSGVPIHIQDMIGGGGQMNVFQVQYHENNYALGLPHDAGVLHWKERVHSEPIITDIVRSIGIPTHPYMEPLQLLIDDIPIPGLLMHPMKSLPFDIRHGKGTHYSTWRYPMQFESISDRTLPVLFQPIIREIASLARNGFHAKNSMTNVEDCINYSVFADQTLHLFLYDLGEMTFEKANKRTREAIATYLLMATLRGIPNIFPDDVYTQNQQYIDYVHAQMWPHEDTLQVDAFWELHRQLQDLIAQ